MASKDREWFFLTDMSEENERFVKKVKEGEKDNYVDRRTRVSRLASENLFDVMMASGGFVETRVLMYYTALGAGNFWMDDLVHTNRMSVIHFLSLYPDVPERALRLYMGLGRRIGGVGYDPQTDLFRVDPDYRHTRVMNGGTALHAAMRSLDLTPMYSSDEYIVDNAVDKIRLLLQHGADQYAENSYGITPENLNEMLEGIWDRDKTSSERWPNTRTDETTIQLIAKTESELVVKPRHVTTPLLADRVSKLLQDADDDQFHRKLIRNVEESPMGEAIKLGRWDTVYKLIDAEMRKPNKDSSWLVETRNHLGLPMIWYFLAAVYNAAELQATKKTYVPVLEFSEILSFYAKNPPNPDTKNEELEQIYWYCVGASFYFANQTTEEGLPEPIVESTEKLEQLVQSAPKREQFTQNREEASQSTDKPSLEKPSVEGEKIERDEKEWGEFPEKVQNELNLWEEYGFSDKPEDFYKSDSTIEFMSKFLLLATLIRGAVDANDAKMFADEEMIEVYDEILGKLPLSQRVWLYKNVFLPSKKDPLGAVRRYDGMAKREFTEVIKNDEDLTRQQKYNEYENAVKSIQQTFKRIVDTFGQQSENLKFFSEEDKQGSQEGGMGGGQSETNDDSFEGQDLEYSAMEDDESGAASSSSGSLPEYDPSESEMRTFFSAILKHSVFEPETKKSHTGVLRNHPIPIELTEGYIGEAIHQAMRVGDGYSLHAIARSRAGKSLGNLDIRHRETKRTPIQTAIHAGHPKDTVSRLYNTLFQQKQ